MVNKYPKILDHTFYLCHSYGLLCFYLYLFSCLSLVLWPNTLVSSPVKSLVRPLVLYEGQYEGRLLFMLLLLFEHTLVCGLLVGLPCLACYLFLDFLFATPGFMITFFWFTSASCPSSLVSCLSKCYSYNYLKVFQNHMKPQTTFQSTWHKFCTFSY